METNAQGFRFGMLAGVDAVKLHSVVKPDVQVWDAWRQDADPLISFNINGYIGYKSKSFWGFSIEPGYIRKGGNGSYVGYVQIPVLADIYPMEKIFFSIGPELAFKNKINYPPQITELTYELSGLIGLNYSILANVDLGLRYSHAFTYHTKSSFPDPFEGGEAIQRVYNQYLQFVVRYKFK
jgi:hypothetical protein